MLKLPLEQGRYIPPSVEYSGDTMEMPQSGVRLLEDVRHLSQQVAERNRASMRVRPRGASSDWKTLFPGLIHTPPRISGDTSGAIDRSLQVGDVVGAIRSRKHGRSR